MNIEILRELMIDLIVKEWPYMEDHEPYDWPIEDLWHELSMLVTFDRQSLKLTRNVVNAYAKKYNYVMFEHEALGILEDD